MILPDGQPEQPSVPQDALIAARGVSVAFAGRTVLDHVDLGVARGEIVTIVGLNGSGKTTLVRVMLGLTAPDSGTVRRVAGLRVGYVPQRLDIDATMPLTVRRFLTLGARDAGDRVASALAEAGVGHLAGAQMVALSGGERRRVILARALLREPDLLVLDEPMSGVDVSGQVELYRLIESIRDRHGCGVLLVSHDLHVVMVATDRVVCLNHHVCCTGQPESVLAHAEFRALFGEHVAQVLALYHHEHDHAHAADGRVVPLDDDVPAALPSGRPG